MPSAILTSTVQAGLLSAVSNVLAQVLTAWRTASPININIVELLQFVTFSLLACPPNCLWQAWLEARFPAYPHRSHQGTAPSPVDETVASHTTGTQFADHALPIKFTLDQTIGATVNTILFIAGIALLRGQNMQSISDHVRTKFWPMTLAGQKLWPAVSILSFTVIPLEKRMLFGSVAGLIWGVYLSLAAGSSTS
ncbi:hypothetical protein CERZMDRAFT_42962 [Cercospora zeae-maydis SCOH1-5]|uniref:Integral membrane protein, Mpv17/PMP22 family n=1 Tax=Cercospora zeae-maydis SCOH1-5 TaxID=717836 RepID=A0A6A6FDX9_9PEZI|nr:hypothetical protein CERZMDRAFT_42962 [Cercospora zeae-maydis SCOH1-5]